VSDTILTGEQVTFSNISTKELFDSLTTSGGNCSTLIRTLLLNELLGRYDRRNRHIVEALEDVLDSTFGDPEPDGTIRVEVKALESARKDLEASKIWR
jgi:hypothetical protein